MQVFLLYGATGCIGTHLVEILRTSGEKLEVGKARIEDRAAVSREIDTVSCMGEEEWIRA